MKLAFAIVLATLTSFSVRAQGQPSPEDLQELQGLADQVKAALQRGDLTRRAASPSDPDDGNRIKQRKAAEPTRQERLAKLEQSAPTGKERFYALPALAKAAFEAGELDKAERYARELLAAAPGMKRTGITATPSFWATWCSGEWPCGAMATWVSLKRC